MYCLAICQATMKHCLLVSEHDRDERSGPFVPKSVIWRAESATVLVCIAFPLSNGEIIDPAEAAIESSKLPVIVSGV